jgi:prolyl-tRNA synthetase
MPIRLEIGKRDMESNSVFMGRRDYEARDKKGMAWQEFVDSVEEVLNDIQNNIYQKALAFRAENSVNIDSQEEFYKFFTPENSEKPEIHGGFAYAHWCGSVECEDKIKEDLKVTIRNIPLDADAEEGKCICCGKVSRQRVVFAKSY